MKKFTVIMPTYNHGGTIELAVASVLAQTIEDFELFIIGDGVPAASRPLIDALVNSDRRIRFFDFPKHVSRGEPYRHQVLQKASGEIVCYMCDRDLWLPGHLEGIRKLLANADFTHSLSLHILPGNKIEFFPCDLSLPEFRKYILNAHNLVVFSSAAHTMDIYHQLPEGWTTTPGGTPTDWYMFKKFLAHKECRTVSGCYPSAITFPSPPRINWTAEQRVDELKHWAGRLAIEQHRNNLVIEILEKAVAASNYSTAKWMH